MITRHPQKLHAKLFRYPGKIFSGGMVEWEKSFFGGSMVLCYHQETEMAIKT